MNQVEELVKVVAEAQADKGNVVIVELKQWEKLTAIDGQDAIVET